MLTVDFDRLGVQEGNLVLDAGCGFGRHSLEFVSRGARVVSMDMDFQSLLKTRYTLGEMKKQFQSGGTEYLVHSGDALNLPFRDETFDRIICSEVMEHVDDDNLACRELARVLKTGGIIAITVPTFFSEVAYDLLTYEYFTSPGGHVRKYLPGDLAKIMSRNGLAVYAIDFKHAFHTIWWIIRSVVGLHRDDHPITRSYHRFLHMGLYSDFMRRAERFCNWFFPKSLVFYAIKE